MDQYGFIKPEEKPILQQINQNSLKTSKPRVFNNLLKYVETEENSQITISLKSSSIRLEKRSHKLESSQSSEQKSSVSRFAQRYFCRERKIYILHI